MSRKISGAFYNSDSRIYILTALLRFAGVEVEILVGGLNEGNERKVRDNFY